MARGKGNRARFTKQAMEKAKAPTRLMPGGDLDGGCEVVQLHGDLEVLRCTLCQQTCEWQEKDQTCLLAGKAPICHFCTITNEDRQGRGKRGTKVGTLRPNIVLYGEEHPSADAVGTITAHDLALLPDVLLILGTSLHVHGLKILVKEFAKAVHGRANGKGKVVFVNLSKPCESVWRDVIDYWVPMDCDRWVDAMRRHRPDMWQTQRELKLSVSKGLGETVSKQIPEPCPASKACGDKENIPSTLHSQKLARPMVMVTPKKKRPLEDQVSRFLGQLKHIVFQSTPTKANRVHDSSQLPTPPSTGRNNKFQGSSTKRSRDVEERDLLGTPWKKPKCAISIWEDLDTGIRRRQLHRV